MLPGTRPACQCWLFLLRRFCWSLLQKIQTHLPHIHLSRDVADEIPVSFATLVPAKPRGVSEAHRHKGLPNLTPPVILSPPAGALFSQSHSLGELYSARFFFLPALNEWSQCYQEILQNRTEAPHVLYFSILLSLLAQLAILKHCIRVGQKERQMLNALITPRKL